MQGIDSEEIRKPLAAVSVALYLPGMYQDDVVSGYVVEFRDI